MKDIFRFCKPRPTFDIFASMIIVNFEGQEYPYFRKHLQTWAKTYKDFALMTKVKFEG